MELIRNWMSTEILHGIKTETMATLKLSSGLIMAELCQLFMQPMAIMFAGRLGKIQFDAVALSNSLINVFGNSIALSAAYACDTVFSQTFGSSNRKYLGVQLQKSMILMMLLFMMCLCLQFNIGPFLRYIKVDETVADLTVAYLHLFAPGMLFLFLYTLIRKYVQVQNVVLIHIVISIIGTAIHGAMQYLFVIHLQTGIKGSAYAQTIGYFSMLACMLIYIYTTGFYEDTWVGFDRRCLLGWGDFLKLAVYSMFMICIEWWAYEATIMIAASRSILELGVQTVLFNVVTIFYGFANGVSLAIATRCGQFIGAGQISNAKRSILVGYSLTGTTSIILASLYAILDKQVPLIFTTIRDVINASEKLTWIFSIFLALHLMTCTSRRILAAIGKQSIGLIVVIVSYYMIGLPIGISLWLKTNLDQEGIWIGFVASIFLCAILSSGYIFINANWHDLALEARNRVNEGLRKDTPKMLTPNIVNVEKSTNCSGESNESTPLLGGSLKEDTVPKKMIIQRLVIIVSCVMIFVFAICWDLIVRGNYDLIYVDINLTNTTSNETISDVTITPPV